MKNKIFTAVVLAIAALIVIVFFFDPFIYDKITTDGSSRYVTRYMLGSKATHTEVGADGFYNGRQITWHLFSEKKRQEGKWKNGYWDGEWIYYDKDERITSIVLYKQGVAKKHFQMIDGKKTEIPKLLIYVKPGMIIKKEALERIKADLKELETVFIGKGKHYIQEDNPHGVGNAIKNWIPKLTLEASNLH